MQIQKSFGSYCEKQQQQPCGFDLMWMFPCKLSKDFIRLMAVEVKMLYSHTRGTSVIF